VCFLQVQFSGLLYLSLKKVVTYFSYAWVHNYSQSTDLIPEAAEIRKFSSTGLFGTGQCKYKSFPKIGFCFLKPILSVLNTDGDLAQAVCVW